MKKIIYILLILLCIISLINYFYFANKANVEKVILKKQGIFNISNETFEFKLNQLKNKNYNVVLKYLIDNESDMTSLTKRTYLRDEYNIIAQISDDKEKMIKLSTINDGSKMTGMRSQEDVEWFLINFRAENTYNYKLRIAFQSKDKFFDKLRKEIYLIQDYDPASLPWWYLLQRISLIMIIISFAGLIATYLAIRYINKKL